VQEHIDFLLGREMRSNVIFVGDPLRLIRRRGMNRQQKDEKEDSQSVAVSMHGPVPFCQ
jgi:hypothetical protein